MSALELLHVDAEQGYSGGEVQVFLLLEGLRARGHRCTLAAPPASRAEAEARARGFATIAVPMRGDADLIGVGRLARALRQHRFDLVHLHTARATWLGGMAARWARVPAITTRRMDRRVRPGLRTRWIYGTLVERVAAISPAVRERLKAGGVDTARTVLIHSAVDPARLRATVARDDVRKQLGAGPNDFVVLALASLVHRKGLDVWLDAVGRMGERANLRVWIAGEGPLRDVLEAQAQALPASERVRFLGRRDDVGDLLRACDTFVLPARAEGLGVSALEAMACGRAVLASRVGGLADAVVDGVTGLLVPPDDARALADACARLIDEPGLCARLGAAGPARVAQGFLPEQMVSAYEELYEEVLAARNEARTASGATR